MKRKIVTLMIALVLLLGMIAIPAQAAPTTEEIQDSIEDGLTWLSQIQHPGGFWGHLDAGNKLYYGEYVARTGFALVKLEDRAYELGYSSPFDPAYEYSENVTNGLDYIFRQARTHGVGTGIYFLDQAAIDWPYNIHETYNTALAMMAIAASRTPDEVVSSSNLIVDGKTYKEVMDGLVQYFVWSQNANGGWGYYPNYPNGRSDNSITGYAVLGLRYAEAALYGFECTIPASLKTSHSNWIDYIQNDQGPDYLGDTNFDRDGGSGYEAPSGWVNVLKTGNLLFEMAFVGMTTDNVAVQNAISYIQRHWDDANQDPGWKGDWTHGPPPSGSGNYQAMYCLMKGFQSLDIDTITVGSTTVDWFDEFAEAIVDTQVLPSAGYGYWPPDNWGSPQLSTCWALLTLEKVSPPPPINVVVEVPECACDVDGYDVTVTYTVERFLVDGTLTVKKDGSVYDTVTLTGFTGIDSVTYNIASDTPGTHTWKAELDVAPPGGTAAHAEDDDSVNVCETPQVGDIPDQTAPFTTFDLDDYLTYSGTLAVTWSASDPGGGWSVSIDGDNVVTVTAPEGANDPVTINFTASVTCCNDVICSNSDDATFTPNQPPDTDEAYAEPGCLWPPNHKFVDISIMGVTDPDGDPVTINIVGITSDEPTATDKGSGGAKHAPDADGVGTDTASVRAECSGNEDGRVYVITFIASDGRGGETEATVMVKVPHDQSDKTCPAIDSGQNYDATGIN